jgi:hypothetical protein
VNQWPVGFVEDIHVTSNTCKDVPACADAGSVSDEKSKDVQIHASSSKNCAGSLLDGLATGDEAPRSVGKLLTVREVARPSRCVQRLSTGFANVANSCATVFETPSETM